MADRGLSSPSSSSRMSILVNSPMPWRSPSMRSKLHCLPTLSSIPSLFRLKNFIDRGIFNVAEALLIGATLVIIVLFLFLLNFRTTFITLTAIPLSLVLTTLVFRFFSWLGGNELSINVMTLGGIAVAMGELVDDAIVDVENIFRRLKENHTSKNPIPAIQVVYRASQEIRNAILFGTMVVILVFIPLFALSGVEGGCLLRLAWRISSRFWLLSSCR